MNRHFKTIFSIWVISCLVFANGCKKHDDASRTSFDELKNGLIEKARDGGRKYIIYLNERIGGVYQDSFGNDVEKSKILGLSAKVASVCDWTNDPYLTIQTISQSSVCGFGREFRWTYRVSSNNAIVAVNSFNNSTKTKGLIRIFNKSNNTLAYSHNTEDVEITFIGVDPDPYYGSLGNNLYDVSFTSTVYIPELYFNYSTYEIRLGANFVTDCSDLQGFSFGSQFWGYSFDFYTTSICDKTDIGYINASFNQILLSGVDPILTCPSGYIYPDVQKVEYSVDGGITWHAISHPGNSTFKCLTGTAYILPFEVIDFTLPNGTYTLQFRYQNVRLINGTTLNSISSANEQLDDHHIFCHSEGYYVDPNSYTVTFQ